MLKYYYELDLVIPRIPCAKGEQLEEDTRRKLAKCSFHGGKNKRQFAPFVFSSLLTHRVFCPFLTCHQWIWLFNLLKFLPLGKSCSAQLQDAKVVPLCGFQQVPWAVCAVCERRWLN